MTTLEDRDVDVVVNGIAEAIEAQRRRALVEHAVSELMWHPVIGEQHLGSLGDALVSADR